MCPMGEAMRVERVSVEGHVHIEHAIEFLRHLRGMLTHALQMHRLRSSRMDSASAWLVQCTKHMFPKMLQFEATMCNWKFFVK